MKQEEWLTIKEVQKVTGLSRSSVLRYLKKGRFESRQVSPHTKHYIKYSSIPMFLRKKGQG